MVSLVRVGNCEEFHVFFWVHQFVQLNAQLIHSTAQFVYFFNVISATTKSRRKMRKLFKTFRSFYKFLRFLAIFPFKFNDSYQLKSSIFNKFHAIFFIILYVVTSVDRIGAINDFMRRGSSWSRFSLNANTVLTCLYTLTTVVGNFLHRTVIERIFVSFWEFDVKVSVGGQDVDVMDKGRGGFLG
jgi:hypothetical protein